MIRCRLLLMIGLVACGNSESSAPAKTEKTAESGRKLAGVYPEKFKCDSIATPDALGSLLGGEVHQLDSALSVPKGVPQPCNYAVNTSVGSEYWTFDIDCRDGMKQRADALFAQYKDTSAQLVDQYNHLADAGQIKPTDAGIPIHAPEGASEVQVGAKALDHHGQGLIFIDDDAPCYVRVVGPDAARRLELAKLVAKNLTFANAPMTPRPMQ